MGKTQSLQIASLIWFTNVFFGLCLENQNKVWVGWQHFLNCKIFPKIVDVCYLWKLCPLSHGDSELAGAACQQLLKTEHLHSSAPSSLLCVQPPAIPCLVPASIDLLIYSLDFTEEVIEELVSFCEAKR